MIFFNVILLFFPLYLAGPSLAKSSGLPPWLTIWAPNLVLFCAASVLYWLGSRR